MGVVRATVVSRVCARRAGLEWRTPPWGGLRIVGATRRAGRAGAGRGGGAWCMAAFRRPGKSPAVVRERLVRVRHAVDLFALLDRAAAVLGGVDQLGRQLARHAVLAALARRLDQPAHRQRHAPRGANLDRYLVGGTTDAPGLDLDRRGHVAKGLLDDFQRVAVLLADDVHGAVDDLLGDRLLAALHHHVDEAGDGLAAVLGVGKDRALRGIAFTRHLSVSSGLRALGAVLGTRLLALGDASGVERAAHGVVTHARQVLDAAAANQHHAVLLQVVALAADVRDDLVAV